MDATQKPVRTCAFCGTVLVLKMRPSGQESSTNFAERRYCDMTCKKLHCKPTQRRSHPWVQAGKIGKEERARKAGA